MRRFVANWLASILAWLPWIVLALWEAAIYHGNVWAPAVSPYVIVFLIVAWMICLFFAIDDWPAPYCHVASFCIFVCGLFAGFATVGTCSSLPALWLAIGFTIALTIVNALSNRARRKI
jgi:hypothetical protein